MSVTS